MQNTIVPGCFDNLESCLISDFQCVPTFEYRFMNIDLPFGRSDIDLLTSLPINLFVADPTAPVNNKKFGGSNRVEQNTLQIVGSFLLQGICVYGIAEGMALNIEGTVAGPQGTVLNDFGSPAVVRNNVVDYFTQLGLPGGVVPHPAEVNFGEPAWRVLEDFMQGHNLVLYCPDNANAELLNEPVSEIGNCCGEMSYEGFGRANHGVRRIESDVNERLAAIIAANDAPNGDYDTWFRSINAVQAAALGLAPFTQGDLLPTRTDSQPSAFGRVRANPSIQYWYKMPCALPLQPGALLRIEFQSDAALQPYRDHMLKTGTMQNLPAWPGQTAHNVPTYENDLAGTHDGAKVTIPAGRLRLGIGLKGFRVSENICKQMAEYAARGQTSLDVLKSLAGGKLACGCR